MTQFSRPIRRAVYARLKGQIGAPAYSSPPANLDPPYALIGAIAAETAETKTSAAAFYTFAVEAWVQSRSPEDLDTLSDAIAARFDRADLTDAQATLSRPIFVGPPVDTWNPEAPGGPTLGRVLTFRLLAQPTI